MSDELQKELDDMIGGLGETSAEEETKTSTEEETDVKSTEEESTGEKPAEEETKEEEVSTDEESETETALTEKEEDKEGEALQVEKLLKRIEELTVVESIESVKPTDKKDETPSKKEESIEVKEVEADSTKIDFIGDAKIDDLVDDKDKLNAVFQAVHARAVSDSNKQVYEKVLRAIPEIVLGHINRNASVGGLVKDFYDANNSFKYFVKFKYDDQNQTRLLPLLQILYTLSILIGICQGCLKKLLLRRERFWVWENR